MLVEDAMILNRWKEYFSKLLNEENPRTIRQEPQRRTEEETPEIALGGECSEEDLERRENTRAMAEKHEYTKIQEQGGYLGIWKLQMYQAHAS